MKVTFYPDNTSFEVAEGTKLIDVAKENNINIADELCSNGICGKCKVLVNEGNESPLTIKERKILSDEEIEAGVRLACSFKITQNTKLFRINAGVNRAKENKTRTVSDNSDNKKYGIVADIGTTNVVCAVFELGNEKNADNKPLAVVEAANPQKLMGMEVVGRIAFANNEKKLEKMQKLITGCVSNLIDRLMGEEGVDAGVSNIEKIVICGNTTMIHMFLGKNVEKLGVYPFSTGYMGGEILEAATYLKNLQADVKLYVPPFIGGHVGSDALCCAYGYKDTACGIKWLMIDMGTNAEIILCNEEKVSACAAAAGPAFEGMGIRYGTKYIEGSVCGANKEHDEMIYDVVGVGKVKESDAAMSHVKGICASGMIDILNELRKCKGVDFFGTFKEQEGNPKGIDMEHSCYYLSKEHTRVCINQADIRNIQLAKSAVLSGVLTLLEDSGLKVEDIDRIILTGAFGNGINIAKAINIRLLPKAYEEKYEFVANAVQDGAAILLCGDSEKILKDMISYAKSIKHMELGHSDLFKDIFIDNMNV